MSDNMRGKNGKLDPRDELLLYKHMRFNYNVEHAESHNIFNSTHRSADYINSGFKKKRNLSPLSLTRGWVNKTVFYFPVFFIVHTIL
jgi:hypothetical protein